MLALLSLGGYYTYMHSAATQSQNPVLKGQAMSQIIALSSLQRAMRFGAACLSESTLRASSQNRLVSDKKFEIVVTYPIGIREQMTAFKKVYGKIILPDAAKALGYEIVLF